MNFKIFENKELISKAGKIAFVILVFVALITLFFNSITVTVLFVVIAFFLAAYGKELIFPYLGNEMRLFFYIGDLGISIVKLFLVVLKAKGSLTDRDLDVLENYFSKEYKPEVGKEVREFVRKNFRKRYNLKIICREMTEVLSGKERVQLITQLFRFCNYTGGITKNQKKIIKTIAKELKISETYYAKIEDKFFQHQKKQEKKEQANRQKSYKNYRRTQTSRTYSLSFAYNELGVHSTISNSDLKKVYRSLAMKYHPDRWAHKGNSERQKAKEKFQRINNAYSLIKKSRNMK